MTEGKLHLFDAFFTLLLIFFPTTPLLWSRPGESLKYPCLQNECDSWQTIFISLHNSKPQFTLSLVFVMLQAGEV